MDSLEYMIPRRLDDQPKILFWDFDQALIVMFALVMGMASGFLMPSGFLGMMAAWGYGKLKSGRHRDFAKHLIYWYMPSGIVGFKRFPESWKREFIG